MAVAPIGFPPLGLVVHASHSAKSFHRGRPAGAASSQVLMRREREIQLRENQFRASGSVNPQERQQLRMDLDGLRAEVERMMNNRDVVARPGGPGYGGNAAATPGIDNRSYEIGQRIDEGVRSGRLNPRQAERLHMRHREFQRHEAFFKSDGVVTQQERRQLRDELRDLNDEVERMAMRNERRGRY